MMDSTAVANVGHRSTPTTHAAHPTPTPVLPHDGPRQSANSGGIGTRNVLNVSSMSLHKANTRCVEAALDTAGPSTGVAAQSMTFFPPVTGACYHARHELCTNCGCSCHPSTARP